MAGLALKLAPGERVFINGVELENGPRRTQILVRTENAPILRSREAIAPEDIAGPAGEAYYLAQCAVAGTRVQASIRRTLGEILQQLHDGATDEETRTAAGRALEQFAQTRLYQVMRCLRPLVQDEGRTASKCAAQ